MQWSAAFGIHYIDFGSSSSQRYDTRIMNHACGIMQRRPAYITAAHLLSRIKSTAQFPESEIRITTYPASYTSLLLSNSQHHEQPYSHRHDVLAVTLSPLVEMFKQYISKFPKLKSNYLSKNDPFTKEKIQE
jgi:hypothetical protein